MPTQLELIQKKTAREMAKFVTELIDSAECNACPAKGKFCRKRPKANCVEILEEFFNSKVKE